MKAKVIRPFKGRAANSQLCRSYKPGDIVEDERVARQAIAAGNAQPISPVGVAAKAPPANKAATPPENKAADGPAAGEAAADKPAARDPRPPAPQPVPLRGERPRR
jgi:hypothetical protein